MIALEGNYHVITALDHDKIVILNPDEIYMARVENEQVVLYGEKRQFLSNKRLYQVADQLGKDFIQISRFTIINLKCKKNCAFQRIHRNRRNAYVMRICI